MAYLTDVELCEACKNSGRSKCLNEDPYRYNMRCVIKMYQQVDSFEFPKEQTALCLFLSNLDELDILFISKFYRFITREETAYYRKKYKSITEDLLDSNYSRETTKQHYLSIIKEDLKALAPSIKDEQIEQIFEWLFDLCEKAIKKKLSSLYRETRPLPVELIVKLKKMLNYRIFERQVPNDTRRGRVQNLKRGHFLEDAIKDLSDYRKCVRTSEQPTAQDLQKKVIKAIIVASQEELEKIKLFIMSKKIDAQIQEVD